MCTELTVQDSICTKYKLFIRSKITVASIMMTAEAAFSVTPGLTKAQTTMLTELGEEGIMKAKDLAKFNKDMWKQIADNLKCLGGRI
eukprot:5687233-Ditylum_brightwellii.AAC.1